MISLHIYYQTTPVPKSESLATGYRNVSSTVSEDSYLLTPSLWTKCVCTWSSCLHLRSQRTVGQSQQESSKFKVWGTNANWPHNYCIHVKGAVLRHFVLVIYFRSLWRKFLVSSILLKVLFGEKKKHASYLSLSILSFCPFCFTPNSHSLWCHFCY